MQVHYDEGVAIHIGPEPCVGVRKDADEASVGEGIPSPPLALVLARFTYSAMRAGCEFPRTEMQTASM